MKHTTLLISEFAPVHTQHEQIVQKHVHMQKEHSDSVYHILFCIDGAQRKLHADSPFTTTEREEMIHRMMKKFSLSYSIAHLHDTDNNKDRVQSLLRLQEDYAHTADTLTISTDDGTIKKLLDKQKIPCVREQDPSHTQSTIRNQFAAQNIQEAQKKLPEYIYEYLREINTSTRMKQYKSMNFRGPNIATDIIIRNKKGEIAIITRRDEPFGNALPGGMIDWGEYGQDTAKREAKEETHAEGTISAPAYQNDVSRAVASIGAKYGLSLAPETQPFYVQTSPTRDMRGHIMTLAYIMHYTGKLQHGDDAEDVVRMSPEETLTLPNLSLHQKEIILAYITQL